MTLRAKLFPVVLCFAACSLQALAQSPEPRRTASSPQAQQQLVVQPNAGSAETVAGEIGLLRKSLQALNARLREISEKLPAAGAQPDDSAKEQQLRISLGLELLGRAEQRAEVLRKQLLELIEKEMTVKSRLVQLEEDMRPESIERASSLSGSTRTPELRDMRRRVFENERRGYESLLGQTSQSRLRLEEDVKQADALVARLRQRVLPLIDREIEKLNPN